MSTGQPAKLLTADRFTRTSLPQIRKIKYYDFFFFYAVILQLNRKRRIGLGFIVLCGCSVLWIGTGIIIIIVVVVVVVRTCGIFTVEIWWFRLGGRRQETGGPRTHKICDVRIMSISIPKLSPITKTCQRKSPKQDRIAGYQGQNIGFQILWGGSWRIPFYRKSIFVQQKFREIPANPFSAT